jgi:hypothetical protein
MLIRAPESWPPAVVAVVAMVILAVLDLIGSFAAKEAVLQRSPRLAVLGLATFVVLFWVQASSLQYADLAPITFGWIVAVQIGVLVLDRVRYQVHLPAGAWVAIGVMVLAQAYLLLLVQQSATEKSTVEASGTSSLVVSSSVEASDTSSLVVSSSALSALVGDHAAVPRSAGGPRHRRASCLVH